MLYPTHPDSKYAENRNAWNLLGSAEAKAVDVPAVSKEDEEVVELGRKDAPPLI